MRAVGNKDAAWMMNDLAEALGGYLWVNGRWDHRVQFSSWAYEAAHALGDRKNASWRAYDVAFIHYNRTRTEDAELWVKRCAETSISGGNRRGQAFATRMRGLISCQRKNYDEAEQLFQETLAIDREFGMNEDVAIALMDLGDLARERKEYETAERYYYQALELALKTEYKMEHTIFSGNLGELALDRKQWTVARKWFEQTLQMARELGFIALIGKSQYGLGRVREAEGRPDLALPLAQEALAIYERLQHKDLAETRELVQRLTAAVQKSAA